MKAEESDAKRAKVEAENKLLNVSFSGPDREVARAQGAGAKDEGRCKEDGQGSCQVRGLRPRRGKKNCLVRHHVCEKDRRNEELTDYVISIKEDGVILRFCVVCLERPLEVLFKPCRHVCTCKVCGAKVVDCPICGRLF